MYFIVAAAREASHLRALPPFAGVLADRGDWVYRDYEKVMKWLNACAAERDALRKTLAERDASIAAAERALAASEHAREQARTWRGWLREAWVRLGILKPRR